MLLFAMFSCTNIMKRFKVIPVQRTEIDMKNRFSEPTIISSLPWRNVVHLTLHEMVSRDEGITMLLCHESRTR